MRESLRPPRTRQSSKRGPTSKDVAESAGVSQSTVSRVLSGAKTELIGEATRQRVLKAAADLRYTPDPIARALRGMSLDLLGVIVRDIGDPFFANQLSELASQAARLGYQVILVHAHSDPSQALQMTTLLETRHTDGFIILGDLRDDEPMLQAILRGHRAVVAMCRGRTPAGVCAVNTDNKCGTRMLLDHLVALGHRRLAFIDGGWWGDIRERRDVFSAFTNEMGIEAGSGVIEYGSNDFGGGYEAMRRVLELRPRPTAVMAADDVLAIGAVRAALELGVKIPDDISITGFDDIPFARFVFPSLTTVRQPVKELSEQALKLLLDLIDGATALAEPSPVRILPELIIRESTGPAVAE